MKRDARIGLAVVLVLGLAVTLLVARSLHNRASEVADQTAAQSEPKAAEFDHATETANATVSAEARAQDQAVMDFRTEHTGAATQPGAATQLGAPRVETVDMPAYPQPVGATPAVGTTGVRPAPTAISNTGRSAVLPPVGEPPMPIAASTQGSASAQGSNALGFYEIAAGDNPWKISSKVFGDGKYAQKILSANPGLNPNRMTVGQKVKIPALPNVTAKIQLADAASVPSNPGPAPIAEALTTAGGPGSTTTDTGAAPATGGARTHKVQAGDSLGKIAKEYLGSAGPKSVKKILDANPGLDAAHLRVGTTIKIP
jgi:nucleoid-associated protein YgaU